MNNQRWKIGELSHIGKQSFCQLNFIYMRLTNIHTLQHLLESHTCYIMKLSIRTYENFK